MGDHGQWTRPPATRARLMPVQASDRQGVAGAGDHKNARRGDGAEETDTASPADWLSRHRATILRGRDLAHVLMPLAPPPARVPLIAASLAAEGLMLADDYRQQRVTPREAGWRSLGVVLDGVGLAAVSSIAPPALARRARGLALVRATYARLDRMRQQGGR
ncbi:MAG: hypothetical protein AAF577_11295 [Pseudomonadota bacterium]